LLITAFAAAQTPSGVRASDTQAPDGVQSSVLLATQEVSVTFPLGSWPWYAQEEIIVHPEPPVAGRPTEVCAEVVNHDTENPHTVILAFGVANFGIGVPFQPVGHTSVNVPPGGTALGCVVWVPPTTGHWCIQATIHQDQAEPIVSQRNIDIWERLVPGVEHRMAFQVGPFPETTRVDLVLANVRQGWQAYVVPVSMTLEADTVGGANLYVSPPAGEPLGSRDVIVDVEGYVDRVLIGGFRKLDWPPVSLHNPDEPFFAESEIHISPYPPRAGEPTEICVELTNISDIPQTVAVEFSRAGFGIGLPFASISEPIEVTIPPSGKETVCITWVPPEAGHFCIQVRLDILGNVPYRPQFSQRNLDVAEPLTPGVPHVTEFPVGNFSNEFTNPAPVPTDIWLEKEIYLPGWEVEFVPAVLRAVQPGEVRWVTMIVTPADAPLPADGTPIVDVRGMVDDAAGGHAIGGFRKVYRPPVALHRFPDPSYAEREITIHPYPPRAGEPTEVCVELYNPTPLSQTVMVQFSWAAFGIGIPFTPIDGLQEVTIPPFSSVTECIYWIPPFSGHVCLQVELFMDGYAAQRSQRNIDIDEPLVPGEPHTLAFPVGNPFERPVTITLGLIPHQPGWEFGLSEMVLPNVEPGEQRVISLTVMPPPTLTLPADNTPIVDVEAYAEGVGGEVRLIGGFRKIHRPPVPLHPFPDPPYAEREITVEPYPPRAGEPTEICVELRNPTPVAQTVTVQFSWAAFGIGVPFTPIDGLQPVHLPPFSVVKECIHWIPPVGGHVCLQVELFVPGYQPQRSQRNIDVAEPLEPLTPHTRVFPVGNPFDHPVTITLGLIPHLDGWRFELSQDVLPNVAPGAVREVSLTVTPPEELPPDRTSIVDVEAYAEGRLIGGFRKIFRPPVPIHRPRDPIYAESEIFIHPYPPRAFEPTETGVEIRNPTEEPQTVAVTFSAADFGIGLPFTPIHEPVVVEVPPLGIARPVIMWIPPRGGLWCIQVAIALPGHREPFISRRNIDVGEPLEPNTPHARPFLVGNPLGRPVTITLGLIPHFPDWGLDLSQDVLPNVRPGQTRVVTLTVTPPADLPADGDAIVDVEAFVDGELLGGFRKIFRPPVPVHRPRDPVYAESEIGVDPYPAIPGQPTKLSVEVFNPTDQDRFVTVTFSIAHFGIGLPFSTANIAPNPIRIFVPKFGAARGHVIWTPPDWRGKFCVRVTLEMEGHEPIWSQRNIDVGEPLRPGVSHAMTFQVGGWPYTEPVTVSLGLHVHRHGWGVALSQDVLPNVQPGQSVNVTLTVTPPRDVELGTGEPIVDVEGFVNGKLVGGFRKLDRPPVPIHKPHEKGYAETEIVIEPYPPQLGVDSLVSTVVQNTSGTTMTVDLKFGWADFGMGIPFTTTGMVPYTRSLTLYPEMTQTATVTWTPTRAGHQCVQIWLSDPEGVYEPQRSQRNVDVTERPPCNQTRVFTFTVYNDTPLSATVEVGLITFNVPADWQITVTPSPTLELGPWSSGVVTVTVLIPCPSLSLATYGMQAIYAIQQASGSVPTIDVEGYVDGKLKGGIEIQFAEPAAEQHWIYLPVVLRN